MTELDYEATLRALLGYIGMRVAVLVTPPQQLTAEPMVMAAFSGMLRRAAEADATFLASQGLDPDDESLVFVVEHGGPDAPSFFAVSRAAFCSAWQPEPKGGVMILKQGFGLLVHPD